MITTPFKSFFDQVKLPVQGVRALQTTRLSPSENLSSASPFNSFNVGLHVDDDPDQVEQNRRCLLAYLPEQANIQWLDQVHKNDVVLVKQATYLPITADAAITRVPKLALAVMTADCLPIILATKQGNEIAVIHGGWRPLSGEIIKHTLNKMKAQPSDIVAWLGPCIGINAFEVGGEVRQDFISLSNSYRTCFIPHGDNKCRADLTKIATIMLTDLGVENISSSGQCTVEHNERYYSYRKEGQTGRMATIICIE